MRIWAISDTHCQHRHLEVPKDIDAVIHAGDEANSRDVVNNYSECLDFSEWWASLPIQLKYFVPGNHSIAISNGLCLPENTLAHNETYVGSIKAFMSPYTPAWGDGWAFMVKRNRLGAAWDYIPKDTQILVTHGPPKGVLDITRDRMHGHLIQVGCSALRKKVTEIKPKLHVFGHIHDERGVSNYGIFERNGTKFVNAAVCDIKGTFKHNGHVIEIADAT